MARRSAAGRGRRWRDTSGASAPVGDVGLVDLVAGVVRGRQAGSVADQAVDIRDGAARRSIAEHALEVRRRWHVSKSGPVSGTNQVSRRVGRERPPQQSSTGRRWKRHSRSGSPGTARTPPRPSRDSAPDVRPASDPLTVQFRPLCTQARGAVQWRSMATMRNRNTNTAAQVATTGMGTSVRCAAATTTAPAAAGIE